MNLKNLLFIAWCAIRVLGCSSSKDLPQSEVINDEIDEPSGVCYTPDTNTLFVVSDEGRLYEMGTDGVVYRWGYLDGFDTEDVCIEGRSLLVAAEGVDEVLVIDRTTLKVVTEIPIERSPNGDNYLYEDDEYGIEGIVLVNGRIFLTNQSDYIMPGCVLTGQPPPRVEDPSMLFSIEVASDSSLAWIRSIDFFEHTDLAAVAYHDSLFYLISDDEDLLLEFDQEKGEVVVAYELFGEEQEGLAFDDEGNMYVADESVGIMKMNLTQFKKSYRRR